ncbi:hypothetical protein AgCh_012149 [Apium graveolens]
MDLTDKIDDVLLAKTAALDLNDFLMIRMVEFVMFHKKFDHMMLDSATFLGCPVSLDSLEDPLSEPSLIRA